MRSFLVRVERLKERDYEVAVFVVFFGASHFASFLGE